MYNLRDTWDGSQFWVGLLVVALPANFEAWGCLELGGVSPLGSFSPQLSITKHPGNVTMALPTEKKRAQSTVVLIVGRRGQ